MKLKYLVTGTGRSGTVFMARFLTSLGIPCGHESIFDWRGIRWAQKRIAAEEQIELSYASQMKWENGKWTPLEHWVDPKLIEAESSYMAAPFLKDDLLKGVPVIHVVRDPVKVINSFCNYIGYFSSSKGTNSYEQFIYRHLPELQREMSAYDRACLYWIRWNQLVEKASPALVHRVEDGPEKLFDFLGVRGPCFSDRTVNSYKKLIDRKFTVREIKNKAILEEFLETGKRYGYQMLSDYLMI